MGKIGISAGHPTRKITDSRVIRIMEGLEKAFVFVVEAVHCGDRRVTSAKAGVTIVSFVKPSDQKI